MRTPRDFLRLSAALVSLSACASSKEGPPLPAVGDVVVQAANPKARSGEIHGADVWTDGTVLTSAVTIAKDGVVTIEPGAKISCAEGVTLYVQGALRAKAKDNHAKISSARWAGVVVSAGGVAELEGLDLENGAVGIATALGALESTYAYGSLLNTLKPFVVSKDSKLTLANVMATTPAKVTTGAASQAEVEGTVVASRLDYDAQASEGIRIGKGGTIDLQDSTIHGKGGADLLSAYEAKKVKVSYTTFTGSHCGIHIQPSESFEFDHVTSESTYGITIYGSGKGPNTVTDSNLKGAAAWLDFQGENGAITFDRVFTTGSELLLGGPVPPTVTKVAAAIPDAKPR